MNELWTLTRLELYSLFGINKFLHTKDKKAKNRYITLLVAWIVLILLAAFYVVLLSVGLIQLGLGAVIPAYLITIASLIIFAFGIFKTAHAVFSTGSYDILSSMPIRSHSVVLSRFISMYTADVLLTAVIMLPGLAVLAIFGSFGASFYLLSLLAVFIVPAIPLVASLLIGTVILAISSRMKHKSLIQTALLLLFFIAMLVGSFGVGGLEELDPDELASLAELVSAKLASLYPPAAWLGSAIVGSDYLGIVWVLLASVLPLTVSVFLSAGLFHKIICGLSSVCARHDYKIGAMVKGTLLGTLYKREAKRYFSSSIYVLNTITGPILAVIISGALCFVGVDAIASGIPFSVAPLAPVLISGVICMMTTTSVSISLEGRGFGVVKSLPISPKALFDSKIAFSLSLMLPSYLISEILLIIALKPALSELPWMLFFPLALIVFSSVFGISVNLKFHSFDWEREEQIVKQSSSAFFGGFAGMLVAIVSIFALILVPAVILPFVQIFIIALLLGLAVLFYTLNNKAKLNEL